MTLKVMTRNDKEQGKYFLTHKGKNENETEGKGRFDAECNRLGLIGEVERLFL